LIFTSSCKSDWYLELSSWSQIRPLLNEPEIQIKEFVNTFTRTLMSFILFYLKSNKKRDKNSSEYGKTFFHSFKGILGKIIEKNMKFKWCEVNLHSQAFHCNFILKWCKKYQKIFLENSSAWNGSLIVDLDFKILLCCCGMLLRIKIIFIKAISISYWFYALKFLEKSTGNFMGSRPIPKFLKNTFS
jgi:hypothetical protein